MARRSETGTYKLAFCPPLHTQYLVPSLKISVDVDTPRRERQMLSDICLVLHNDTLTYGNYTVERK